MNKSLLAIAVGAAVTFPGLAMADGPKVYGKVNLSLENIDVDDGTTSEDSWELANNASRLGVKGDFDLDFANMEAFYKAEFEIHPDDGKEASGDDVDQVIDQRDIYGGIRGNFGAIQAGHFDSPLKDAQLDVDQFNDLNGDIKNIVAGENRFSNQIMYSTPELADLITVHASFIPGEGADLDGDGTPEDDIADAFSLAAVLEQDLFYGAVARDTDVADKLEVDSTGASTLDITRVVAGVTPANLEFGALYQIAEEVEGDGEDTSVLVSGAVKIERVKLKAQYGLTEADTTDEEATQLSLGADYKLAKASKVFIYGTQLELDEADTEETTIGVGMQHKF